MRSIVLFLTCCSSVTPPGLFARPQEAARSDRQVVAIGRFRPLTSSAPRDAESLIARSLRDELQREGFTIRDATGSDPEERLSSSRRADAAILIDGYYGRNREGNLTLYGQIYNVKTAKIIDAFNLAEEWAETVDLRLDPDEIREADGDRARRFARRLAIRLESNPRLVERRSNIDELVLSSIVARRHPEVLRYIQERAEDPVTSEVFRLFDEAVVVTATRARERITDAPASVTVIRREDIEKYGYRSLPEALARVPEVYTHYNGHNFSADFRGFFVNNVERRVLYLLNGQKLNDRFHFGDFYPDVIADLSNVERIEVIRGPGAALYGNNAVLGVVNIITKDPVTGPGGGLVLAEIVDVKRGGSTQKLQVVQSRRYSPDLALTINLAQVRGSVPYDTHTAWENRSGAWGRTTVVTSTDAYFDADRSFANDAFERGEPLPNFHLEGQLYDFTVGAYLYSRRVSWVWPKDNNTFGHPDNDRSWGTGSVFVKYAPRENLLAEMDFEATLSQDVNTNREIADFDTIKSRGRVAGVLFGSNRSAWIWDPFHGFTNYINLVRTVHPYLEDDDEFQQKVIENGGGTRFNYHGIDRTTSLDVQITPYESRVFRFQAGAGAVAADYDNYQRVTFRNNAFIGWSRFGGISDSGRSGGAWIQTVLRPLDALTLTAGVRYDRQWIETVNRQLGGTQLYRCEDSADNEKPDDPLLCEPIRDDNRVSEDVTPRVALNYRFTEDHNLRLIYGEAFRAVPPQEVIRLPREFGRARSEKTRNAEIVYSGRFYERFGFTANAFHLEGDRIYAFVPALAEFAQASGWSNTGGSLGINYAGEGFEVWSNGTLYDLQRATDSYSFRVYPFTENEIGYEDGIPLPPDSRPLDSPELLFRVGGAYEILKRTFAALEIYHNGPIEGQHPPRNEISRLNGQPIHDSGVDEVYELAHVHRVPPSTYVNLSLARTYLSGLRLQFKIENLFNQAVYGVLPVEAEGSWSVDAANEDAYSRGYQKPHQLPGFGRVYSFQVSHTF